MSSAGVAVTAVMAMKRIMLMFCGRGVILKVATRRMLKPLADKKSSFKCKATLVEVDYAPVSYEDSRDNCFDGKI